MYIINGHIKTMAGEEYENGWIHILDGKIAMLGWGNPLILESEKENCEILDAKGNLVMPGIIEAHCHMGITEEKKAIEGDDCNENVEPITPFLRAIDAINSMDAAFGDAIRAGITSAMIGPGSSNVVGGQFVFMKTSGRRVDDIFTAIRIAKEFDVEMTLDHCSEGHLIAEEIANEGFPAIVGPDLASRSKIEVQNMAFKTAGVLSRAGVKVAITTDHPVSLIRSLPICVGLAVKAGLPMEEGYKSMTRYAAEICRVEHRVGTIEVGKDANTE